MESLNGYILRILKKGNKFKEKFTEKTKMYIYSINLKNNSYIFQTQHNMHSKDFWEGLRVNYRIDKGVDLSENSIKSVVLLIES